MQQRQLRLGDILDDYCPRERRVTNHAIVAMVGDDVKQTRCTTCDADHEYKHAKVPRQRKKSESAAALLAHAAPGPKRVVHEASEAPREAPQTLGELVAKKEAEEDLALAGTRPEEAATNQDEHDDDLEVDQVEEGPVHRPLIRATLPRPEGQPPPARPAPDFTIRQPGGRANRFRPRHQRGGTSFGGGRSNGNVGGGYSSPGSRGPQGPRGPNGPRGSQGSQGSRGPMSSSRPARHHDRKRSK
jgi:hypothetical protein